MGKFVEDAIYIVEIALPNGRCKTSSRKFKNVQQLENFGRMNTKKGKNIVRIYQCNARKNFWKFGRI